MKTSLWLPTERVCFTFRPKLFSIRKLIHFFYYFNKKDENVHLIQYGLLRSIVKKKSIMKEETFDKKFSFAFL